VLFNSVKYFIFLPLVLSVHLALPRRFQWIWLLGVSYYFYASWSARHLLLMIGNTLVAYVAGLLLERYTTKRARKRVVAVSATLLLGTLFAFKYFAFARDSLDAMFRFFGVGASLPVLEVVLPAGISFYTFQALAYVIEVYRGDVPAERRLGIFATFKAFFPQLVAGPIERPARLIPQLSLPARFDYDRAINALTLILWGLFKKIVIADRLALYVNEVYNDPSRHHGVPILLATYFFAFQIYCDFSGYSDMAVGSARLFGVELMQNFDRPYFSRSIREFWLRWHISLSTWFRDYLYIPLGGNRVGRGRNYVNLMIVFLVSGLWHGAAWTFVIWGALHGVYLLLELSTSTLRSRVRSALRLDRVPRLHAAFQMMLVFHLVALGWLFFRANSLADATTLLVNLCDPSSGVVLRRFDAYEITLSVTLIAVLCAIHGLQKEEPNTADWISRLPAAARWPLAYGFCIAILLFGEFNVSEFIYFQF
jgi:D-alanyl-lipoteichoic acid acyltransferase DltB (MBOAT superfamily)